MANNLQKSALTDAQRKLVEDNIRLVYLQAHKRGIRDEDLIQEGMMGLINAARDFSEDFGVKFSTYACSCIWAALFGSYSQKKWDRQKSVTDSLDDPDLDLQPSYQMDMDGCICFYGSTFDNLTERVVRCIGEGFNKKETRELLNISVYKLNAILNKVGRLVGDEKRVSRTDK